MQLSKGEMLTWTDWCPQHREMRGLSHLRRDHEHKKVRPAGHLAAFTSTCDLTSQQQRPHEHCPRVAMHAT